MPPSTHILLGTVFVPPIIVPIESGEVLVPVVNHGVPCVAGKFAQFGHCIELVFAFDKEFIVMRISCLSFKVLKVYV